MKFPEIRHPGVNTLYTNSFGGINKSEGSPLGEWEELIGFDLRSYPALSTVKPVENSVVATTQDGNITGATIHDGNLIYTVPTGIYIKGNKLNMTLTDGKKQLVNIGGYVMIFPDMTEVLTIAGVPYYSSARANDLSGTLYEKNITEGDGYKTKELFLRVPNNVNTKFKVGQTVILRWDTGKNVKVEIISRKNATETDPDTGEKKFYYDFGFDVSTMPDTNYFYIMGTEDDGSGVAKRDDADIISPLKNKVFRFAIEHNNRMWACSGDGHEIYCSKLGDALEWGEYKGASTDCYTVTVGSEGRFTGSAIFGDKVVFFKENCAHCIYGTKPSNFTVTHYKLSGIKSGCEKSVCNSGGLLYYQGRNGIYAFNGNSSYRIDTRLGKHGACTIGSADEDTLCMVENRMVPSPDGSGYIRGSICYIYDFAHDAWHKEYLDSVVEDAFSYDGIKLLMQPNTYNGEYILRNISKPIEILATENTSHATAISGNLLQNIPYTKHPVKIKLLTDNYVSGRLKIELSDNNGADWKTVYEKGAMNTGGIITIPITMPRLFRLKMRIEVQGGFSLYGMYIITEEGSELT